jgi:membrane protein required for colicin V production
MNWVDWAIVVVLTLSSIIALARGFFREAFSLVFWITAVVVAKLFSHQVELLLVNLISTPSVRFATAFIGVFVAVLLLGALISFGIGLLVKATGLSGTDRLVGMVFGCARGLFIVINLLIYVPVFAPIKSDHWFRESTLIPYFTPYEALVKNATGQVTSWVANLLARPSSVKIYPNLKT